MGCPLYGVVAIWGVRYIVVVAIYMVAKWGGRYMGWSLYGLWSLYGVSAIEVPAMVAI